MNEYDPDRINTDAAKACREMMMGYADLFGPVRESAQGYCKDLEEKGFDHSTAMGMAAAYHDGIVRVLVKNLEIRVGT